MTNPKRGVPFEAAGQMHNIAFTTAAMVRYQRAAGETLVAGVLALEQDGTDADRLCRIFGAGLDGQKTEDDVFGIIDAVGYAEAIKLVGLAFRESFPVPEAEAGNGSAGKRGKKAATP